MSVEAYQPFPVAALPEPLQSFVTNTAVAIGCDPPVPSPADDNGTGGRISSYDLRYSTATISAANWDAATQVTGEPAPAAPGQQEVFTVGSLSPSTTYFFAIKSADAAMPPNISALSAIASATTDAPDTSPPAPVTDLAATAIDANQLTLAWTASGDDGTTGSATAYDIRYSTDPITGDVSFAGATAVEQSLAPKPAGQAESLVVPGLTAATRYYFALKVADEVPNTATLSNVLEATTLPPDVTAPAPIADLSGVALDSARIELTWTAPGDDADAGTAVSYDIRYSTAPINLALYQEQADLTQWQYQSGLESETDALQARIQLE